MKSLMLIIPAILILACGTDNREDENDSQTVTVEQSSPEEVQTELSDNVEIEESLYTNYLLKKGAAGIFETYMRKEEILELAEQFDNIVVEETEIFAEGNATPALELTFDPTGSILLELSETDPTVYRINVTSEMFRTEKGIGVGSTYYELANNYEFEELIWGEAGRPMAIVPEAGMTFIIEEGDWWQSDGVVGDIIPHDVSN